MHTEILNKKQSHILPPLAKALQGSGMYLAGGTALALQIGHRPSVDFDWFSQQLGNPDILLRKLTEHGVTHTVLSVSHETVYVEANTVQLSFIGYSYPLLRNEVLWLEYGLRLASLEDIACMKLSAITNRGARKDFIDLFFIFKEYLRLEECLRLFTVKFQQRDIGHVLRSLVYFEDADEEPDVVTNIPVDWNAIRKEFERLVKTIK